MYDIVYNKPPKPLKEIKMAKVKVKVVNRDSSEYSETLSSGETKVIPGNGYILMNRSEAVKFLGTFPGTNPNTGKPILKKLVIENIVDNEPEQKPIVEKSTLQPGEVECPFCGFIGKNKLSLATHLRTCKG